MSYSDAQLDSKIEEAQRFIGKYICESNLVVASTKFGPDSLAFLHLISHIDNSTPIIWVDTGYNQRDTVQFAAYATSLLGLNLRTFYPSNHEIRIPPALDDSDHQAFTEEVKLLPFKQALTSLKASHWLSSVRAYQTDNRRELSKSVQLTTTLTKVHPMLDWTTHHIEAYLQRYSLAHGPETFDPTKGESFRECGLHQTKTWV